MIAIYDADGNIVAKYTYDTWGAMVAITNANGEAITDQDHIANVNPIRYRGYYYDTETKLYYLQSRYYNPQWGRFLNADVLFIAGEELLGSNMFAYCGNNPVMGYDPSGMAKVSSLNALAIFGVYTAILYTDRTSGGVVYSYEYQGYGYTWSTMSNTWMITIPGNALVAYCVKPDSSLDDKLHSFGEKVREILADYKSQEMKVGILTGGAIIGGIASGLWIGVATGAIGGLALGPGAIITGTIGGIFGGVMALGGLIDSINDLSINIDKLKQDLEALFYSLTQYEVYWFETPIEISL